MQTKEEILKNRIEGFYWVKWRNEWKIFYWNAHEDYLNNGFWTCAGSDEEWYDKDFDEIDESILAHTTAQQLADLTQQLGEKEVALKNKDSLIDALNSDIFHAIGNLDLAEREIKEKDGEIERLRLLFRQYCNSSIDIQSLLYPFHDIDTEQFD